MQMTKIRVMVGQFALVGDSTFEHRPGYQFTYDCACTDYDWFVSYEDISNKRVGTLINGYESLRCPKERTIFCTWEPTSVKSYSKSFTRQFGHLLTNRPPEAEQHPHYHLGRGYFFWFNDRSYRENATVVLPPKTKLISAVCSNKQMKHTKHAARFALMEALCREVDGFEWYGRGVRAFGKKFEVMDPYKYHVAIENHIGPHHWTEKLADALLCECLPFYAGDPLIGECLPPECLIPIPIDDPVEAVKIIKSSIAAGEYEKRREAILEAKRLILEKYNFWDQIIAVIEASKNQAITPVDAAHPVRIYSRHELRKHSPLAALEDVYLHAKRGFK